MRVYRSSSDDYFKHIKQNEDEWQTLIDELIIPETSFFRHVPSFELVKKHLSDSASPFHIWSVGCSTGEEAWSLAILAEQMTPDFKVMATDVSMHAINSAQQGIYSARKIQTINPDLIDRYFTKVNANEGSVIQTPTYQIAQNIRQKVSFYRHNLVEEKRLPFREMDIIFCQNVLIYFRNFVQRDILNQLVKSLSVGGLLIVAPAEARSWQHPDMVRVDYAGTLAFKRVR